MTDEVDRSGEVAALAARVAALEAELARWRQELTDEVRTRRVVVEDRTGVERVVLAAGPDAATAAVRVARPGRPTTGMELYASELEDGQLDVGWCAVRDGEVVSRWTSW